MSKGWALWSAFLGLKILHLLISCGTLGKLLNLSVTRFPHLLRWESNNSYNSWEDWELIHVKSVAWRLACNRRYLLQSCYFFWYQEAIPAWPDEDACRQDKLIGNPSCDYRRNTKLELTRHCLLSFPSITYLGFKKIWFQVLKNVRAVKLVLLRHLGLALWFCQWGL